jgi:hypothetical protein
MPRTTAQQERSLQDPAVCELLKIRDFLDNVMVRTDGCYVAGFRVQGSVTYFADDEGRNEAKGVVESLLRAMPEQSMRVQFRYEVVESLNGLLDRYRDASRSETPEVKVLDDRRLATWEEKERLGAYRRWGRAGWKWRRNIQHSSAQYASAEQPDQGLMKRRGRV